MLEVEPTDRRGPYGHRKWPKRQQSHLRHRFTSIRQVATPSIFPRRELPSTGAYRFGVRYVVVINRARQLY